MGRGARLHRTRPTHIAPAVVDQLGGLGADLRRRAVFYTPPTRSRAESCTRKQRGNVAALRKFARHGLRRAGTNRLGARPLSRAFDLRKRHLRISAANVRL